MTPPRAFRRSGTGGQAAAEFALALGLALLLLLGATQAGLYALERTSATTAAEWGALVAAGAGQSPASAASAGEVDAAMVEKLTVFGASVRRHDPVAGACPVLSPTWPLGTVFLCTAPRSAQRLVEVAIRGWVPAMVPPAFGLSSNWRGGALPIDIDDVVHTTGFAP